MPRGLSTYRHIDSNRSREGEKKCQSCMSSSQWSVPMQPQSVCAYKSPSNVWLNHILRWWSQFFSFLSCCVRAMRPSVDMVIPAWTSACLLCYMVTLKQSAWLGAARKRINLVLSREYDVTVKNGSDCQESLRSHSVIGSDSVECSPLPYVTTLRLGTRRRHVVTKVGRADLLI
jgi:hypothetical protein